MFLKLSTRKAASVSAPVIRKRGQLEEVVQHIQTLFCVFCRNKAAFMFARVCLSFAAMLLCSPALSGTSVLYHWFPAKVQVK